MDGDVLMRLGLRLDPARDHGVSMAVIFTLFGGWSAKRARYTVAASRPTLAG